MRILALDSINNNGKFLNLTIHIIQLAIILWKKFLDYITVYGNDFNYYKKENLGYVHIILSLIEWMAFLTSSTQNNSIYHCLLQLFLMISKYTCKSSVPFEWIFCFLMPLPIKLFYFVKEKKWNLKVILDFFTCTIKYKNLAIKKANIFFSITKIYLDLIMLILQC